MNNLIFTHGDQSESLDIMREAAKWLIEKDNQLWPLKILTAEELGYSPDQFIVMYNQDHDSIATLAFCQEDDFFWPAIPHNTAGFIHKLAIRRKFSGKSYIKDLLQYTIQLCRKKGLNRLCLDCDADRKNLRIFYESLGFDLVETKEMNLPKIGKMNIALYSMKL